jgi:phage terminase large subunit-like protein
MTYTARADRYASDVIAGRIPACKHVKRACERHVRDLQRSAGRWPYRYDAKKAEHVCAFMERLPHTKGKWARINRLDPSANLLRLEPWQVFILCSIFGWVDKTTGKRRFRRASIYVPRKNGKSLFGAGIGLYMFAFDDEPGAEVYSGATSQKQAWEVFKPARQIAVKTPDLVDFAGITVNAASLIIEGDGSKFEPVIGAPGDGASPHCAIVDEYHEHPTSVLYDTMRTGMGAREQPLLLIISTAGDMLQGPCRDDWSECEKLLAGAHDDDSLFAIIFTVDDEAEWGTEAGLAKANPNWGVSVIPHIILADLEEAKRDPKKQSSFKTKHCNLWVSAKDAFFNVELWTKLARPVRMEDFKGCRCVISADAALKHDIFPVVLAFQRDDTVALFTRNYIPRETANLPQKQHYRKWESEGRMIVHDGAIVDYREILEDVWKLYTEYGAEEFVYDPAKLQLFANDMTNKGAVIVDAYSGNGVKMPEWLNEFDGAYRAGRIIHDGDPVLTWAISNAVAKPAKRGMFFLTKDGNEKKIDPAIAALMAYGRLTSGAPAPSGDEFAVAKINR